MTWIPTEVLTEAKAQKVTTHKTAHVHGWVHFNFKVFAKPAYFLFLASMHPPGTLENNRGSQAKEIKQET